MLESFFLMEEAGSSILALTNARALHHSTCIHLHSSLLGNRILEQVSFKETEKTPTMGMGRVVMMNKKEPLKATFARRVERPFLVEKRKTPQMSKKELSAYPLSIIAGLGDMQAGIAVYKDISKYISSKDMQHVNNFLKNRNITHRNLIELTENSSKKLMDVHLPYAEEIYEIAYVLKKTFNYNNITATTVFEKQDIDYFSQERHVAVFFLETKFKSKDSWLTRTIEKTLNVFDESMCSESETWHNLKYKVTRVIQNNLADELTRLEDDLGRKLPTFPLTTKVCSLSADHFSLKVSEANEIVWAGLSEYQRANERQKPLVYTRACERLETLCEDSLIDGYNKIYQACYQDELFSSTGRTTEKKRKKSCMIDFAEVNKLDPEVRSRLCSDDSDDDREPTNWYTRE